MHGTRTNLQCADERFMSTGPIVPMEQEMFDSLTRKHGFGASMLEFRQRVSAYHLRFNWWHQLPAAALADIRLIAQAHGYEVVEFENLDSDRFTRWSYDFTHKTPLIHENARTTN